MGSEIATKRRLPRFCIGKAWCWRINFSGTKFPGIENYLIDDQRVLRKHVNIFVNGSLIKDREQLTDALTSDSEVYIMQALSGG